MSPEALWGAILVLPYVVVFVLFVAYPVAYGLWLGASPASYARALERPDLRPHGLSTPLVFLVVGST